MPSAIIVLLIVLFSIMLRGIMPIKLPIWSTMLLGAVAVLLLGDISWRQAVKAINDDVMCYLFGVFIIAQALERCGYLALLTDRLFKHAKDGSSALLIIVFVLGLAAALLMNDTIAIVGTPIILQLARKQPKLITPLLLALAYSITLGSVLSPIGNPQNLLIAIKGPFASPFIDFFNTLALPTLISLLICWLLLRLIYRKQLTVPLEKSTLPVVNDRFTAYLCKISLLIMLLLIIVKILLSFLMPKLNIDFSIIALVAAAPIVIASRQRGAILRHLDWGTLVFFVAMFILMQSVWQSGFFQHLIQQNHLAINSLPMILLLSSVISQLISNVPLVALYLPLLKHVSAPLSHYLALAAGSTIAGNLFIFGAASNIIILQNTEKRQVQAFGFLLFSVIGIGMSILTLMVYYVFLT